MGSPTMTPPRRKTAHTSVAITGTDVVGQSFRSGLDPHQSDLTAMAGQGRLHTTPKTSRVAARPHPHDGRPRMSHLAVRTAKATHEHPRRNTHRKGVAAPTVRSRRSGNRGDPTSPTTPMVMDRKHAAGHPCCRAAATPPPTAPKPGNFPHTETNPRSGLPDIPGEAATRATDERRDMSTGANRSKGARRSWRIRRPGPHP